MHGKHRHARVHGVDIAVGKIHRHRAAAALIDLAKLAGLPDHARLVEDAADARHQLGCRVRRAGLAARARVLDQRKAAVGLSVVALLRDLREVGVKGVAHVRGQAHRIFIALLRQRVLRAAQIRHEGVERARLHAGHTVRSGLLLIHQQADAGMRGRALHIQQGGCRGVRAHAVVMAV